jgi:hypothetical protein
MKRVVFALVPPLLCTVTAAAQFTFVPTERKGGMSSTTQEVDNGVKFRLDPARQEFARVDTQALMAKPKEQLKGAHETNESAD